MQKLPNGESTGVDNAAPEIVWPSRVVQPARPQVLVYLDLNHYINLARTAAGPRRLTDTTACCGPLPPPEQQDRAVFPLSGTHYMEMSGILDPAQRTAVAEVMESLSGFRVLLGRVTLAELEIDAMIDAFLRSGSAAERIDLLGPTFGWAFGMRGGLTIRDGDGNDGGASMREEVGDREFERIMAEATLAFERGMLAGPPDEEIAALRVAGYAPEKTREVAERRAQQERDLSARLDEEDRWQRGRLRDLVSASELTHEWLDQITRATLRPGNQHRAGRGRGPGADAGVRRGHALEPGGDLPQDPVSPRRGAPMDRERHPRHRRPRDRGALLQRCLHRQGGTQRARRIARAQVIRHVPSPPAWRAVGLARQTDGLNAASKRRRCN